MTKRVLDVGNCDFDHGSIRRLIEQNFDAEVTRAHDADETLRALRQGGVDLVLINRRLYRDQSAGVEIIQRIKADAQLAAVPVMLVTNFPEHQQRAIGAGAEPGFGKAELSDPATCEKLRRFLGADAGEAC